MPDLYKNYNIYVVDDSASVIDILQRQELHKVKTVIVVNKERKVLGTVSDGDIRRYYLENLSRQK